MVRAALVVGLLAWSGCGGDAGGGVTIGGPSTGMVDTDPTGWPATGGPATGGPATTGGAPTVTTDDGTTQGPPGSSTRDTGETGGDTGTTAVDPPDDLPAMTRKIRDLTGPGTSAKQWGVGGTDLGIPVRQPNGQIAYIFGDTFENDGVGGPG